MLIVCILQIIILVYGWTYAFGDEALYTLQPVYVEKAAIANAIANAAG